MQRYTSRKWLYVRVVVQREHCRLWRDFANHDVTDFALLRAKMMRCTIFKDTSLYKSTFSLTTLTIWYYVKSVVVWILYRVWTEKTFLDVMPNINLLVAPVSKSPKVTQFGQHLSPKSLTKRKEIKQIANRINKMFTSVDYKTGVFKRYEFVIYIFIRNLCHLD